MPFHAIVGGQRGDEGKGRFVDLVAPQYSVIARGNGGANAGHTVVPDGSQPIALHQVPSGITYSDKLNVIGNGVYLDPVRLLDELEAILKAGLKVSPKNLQISDMAHLVLPHHILLDGLREGGANAQGSTKTGIAYVAADKYLREGLRLEAVTEPKFLLEKANAGLNAVNISLPRELKKTTQELKQAAKGWVSAVEKLKPFMADTVTTINGRLAAGEMVLGEGAQAFWLDINHGMYPMVTSSSTTVNGLLDGLGVAAKHLEKVTVVAKAIKSHVGGGPFVTEITDQALAETIRGPRQATDSEYGATTKRPRRIGYPDLVELKQAILINGADEIVLSKLDHVPRYGKTLKVATAYNCKGKLRQTAPSSALALAECTPSYKKMANWQQDISHVRNYAELPGPARALIDVFEEKLGVPITKIGVGPERNQVILR
jgi:adenylosuccinate synthase